MVVPSDSTSFKECLKSFGRKPGPIGNFNSIYMAFSRNEAAEFPNLVSLHSLRRKIKTDNTNLAETRSPNLKSKAPIKSPRHRLRTKQDTTYPITTITGHCESTIGGLEGLCAVCPAVTDLSPGKIPSYINEILCGEEESCGECGIIGVCKNTSVVQDFLMMEGISLKVYSQPIRVCCECGLFQWADDGTAKCEVNGAFHVWNWWHVLKMEKMVSKRVVFEKK